MRRFNHLIVLRSQWMRAWRAPTTLLSHHYSFIRRIQRTWNQRDAFRFCVTEWWQWRFSSDPSDHMIYMNFTCLLFVCSFGFRFCVLLRTNSKLISTIAIRFLWSFLIYYSIVFNTSAFEQRKKKKKGKNSNRKLGRMATERMNEKN